MRVIAAAIKFNGVVFTGDRHGHIIKYMVQIGVLKDMKRDKILDKHQGFIDEKGEFWDRDESRRIAIVAQQVWHDHGVLYSEDLW